MRDYKLLIITTPFAWASDTKSWINTSYGSNVVFVKLQEESNVTFIATDSELLIDLTRNEDQELDYLTILRGNSIITMCWKQCVSQMESTEKFLKSGQ